MGMRVAIVVGATGLTGSELVKKLCENDEYVSVTVIARRKPKFEHPKLEVKIRSFDTLEEDDIEFAHELYCCLGTTIKKAGSKEEFEKVDFEYPLYIASLAKKRGIPHFLIITAMGADEKSLFYYNRVKGKLEQSLAVLDLQQLSIIRPSLLVGEREDFRLGEKSGELFLRLLNPLLVGPLNRYRSIEVEKVANAMMLIALYKSKKKFEIFTSDMLNKIEPPPALQEENVSREELFNWEKRKDLFTNPTDSQIIDNDVAFNRDKFTNEGDLVDKEVIFKRDRQIEAKKKD